MQFISVFHVLVSAALVAIVLVQRGAGATAGAAFGAGASGTVFGSQGAGNFLTKTTSWLAIAFFGLSMAMAVAASRVAEGPVEEDLGVMAEPAALTSGTDETGLPSDSDLPAATTDEINSSDLPETVDDATDDALPPSDEGEADESGTP